MTLHPLQQRLRGAELVQRTGRVRRIMPTYVECDGPNVRLGSLCSLQTIGGAVPAEVVRVDRTSVTLSVLEEGAPTFSGARVRALADGATVPVGAGLLGRAVDALGRPIDGGDPVRSAVQRPIASPPPLPLERISPKNQLETGVRAIDGLLTLGVGQRIGVFAASGVGKTSLMTQIAQQTRADVTILCLVGERGREVEALWSNGLTDDAKAHTTLVAATSDQSAAMRVRAGHYALALADYWRGQGKHVLLLLDSVTRLAMALRELGLAAGEPPTVRAYTPSVFAIIPKMVERCGALRSGGAITAVMTILSESDEVDDPISELMKSLLDGHILLSRALAEEAHFPAIDIARSVSRQADGLVSSNQHAAASTVLEWISLYDGSRTLIDTGLYAQGSNVALDRAIERRGAIRSFLRQPRDFFSAADETRTALANLVEAAP